MNTNQNKICVGLFTALVFSVALPAHAGSGKTGEGIVRLTKNDAAVDGAAQQKSLYDRLGGYDAIAAVVDDLVGRLATDPKLGRFWANRGADGVRREKQLVINFIVDRAGGPLFYSGRDMVSTHKGMKISDEDWKIFMMHLNATLAKFRVPDREKSDVIAFMESLKATIVA